MSAQPDPVVPPGASTAALPAPAYDSSSPNGAASAVDQHPELLAAGGFAGGLVLALILKRLGS